MATRKEALKGILRALHGGLSPEQARLRVIQEVGSIETKELVKIEQELIDEGLPAEEITRFCNVHVLLVKDSLVEGGTGESGGASGRPVSMLKQENAEIQSTTERVRSLVAGDGPLDLAKLTPPMARLAGLDRHYAMKENLFFPYLEKHGFPGPSKVMWQKDNEVRGLYKTAAAELARLAAGHGGEASFRAALGPFLDEAEGMITKEEQILFPAAVERLDATEWAKIAIEMDEIGYAFIAEPGAGASAVAARPSPQPTGATVSGGSVVLPSGRLTVGELEAMLNALPFDVSFVDADDKVRYFTEGKERIFMRTRAVIGRSVANCHPPKSLAAVQKVMDDLRSGRADHHDFWIEHQGKMVFIRYFAVRDAGGKYLGTLEVTQDVTGARALQGEKRLVQ